MGSVVVVGAGMGGLSAAIRLASRGQRVTVVEKLGRPGGKMGEVRAEGYRWDTGPSVITMKHVFEQVFRDAGQDLRDYVDLVPINPITRYFWRDGATIDAVANEDAMCENIRRAFGPSDVDGYRRFMRYVEQLYQVVSGPFLYRAKPTVRDLLRLPLANVFKIDALRTMHQAVRAHFANPHLIQLFDRFATYNGSSPYLVPATLNVISYVEMAQGAWYPKGGVFQLATAFERLAMALGVDVRYNCEATRIEQASRRVTGVALADGTTLAADAVVCNVDYTFAQNTLLSAANDPSASDKAVLEPSCSGFVLLMGVAGQHDALAHHNIFFSDDYPREFDDIFKRKVAAADPTVYVCITSKTDAEHAPPDHENWFVLVNAPYLTDAYDWREHTSAYAQAVKTRLLDQVAAVEGTAAVAGNTHLIRTLTPADLQAHFGGHQGAIYGFSSNNRTAAFMRPGNRSGNVRGLYYASGSAHPGGGVPLVTLSGIAAANCMLDDFGTK